jgi:hypothetical protein
MENITDRHMPSFLDDGRKNLKGRLKIEIADPNCVNY